MNAITNFCKEKGIVLSDRALYGLIKQGARIGPNQIHKVHSSWKRIDGHTFYVSAIVNNVERDYFFHIENNGFVTHQYGDR